MWAVLKSLGREGVEKLIDQLCDNTVYFAQELEKAGFTLVNSPYFNQFMIRGESPEETNRILKGIQESGICWCGGRVWEGVPVIRISVCSHATTKEDIDRSVEAFRIAMTR